MLYIYCYIFYIKQIIHNNRTTVNNRGKEVKGERRVQEGRGKEEQKGESKRGRERERKGEGRAQKNGFPTCLHELFSTVYVSKEKLHIF